MASKLSETNSQDLREFLCEVTTSDRTNIVVPFFNRFLLNTEREIETDRESEREREREIETERERENTKTKKERKRGRDRER